MNARSCTTSFAVSGARIITRFIPSFYWQARQAHGAHSNGFVAFRVGAQVGAELLYIAQAPRLALNGEDFVEFPDVSQITETYDKKVSMPLSFMA